MFVWLFAFTTLLTVVPLHFYVNSHEQCCDSNQCKDNTGCCICDFQLYIGYDNRPVIKIERVESLIAVLEEPTFTAREYSPLIYKNRRGPPSC